MNFDFLLARYKIKDQYYDFFDGLNADFGPVEKVTWNKINSFIHNNLTVFESLATRKITSIIYKCSKNKILSPSDVDKIIVACTDKKLCFNRKLQHSINNINSYLTSPSGFFPHGDKYGVLRGVVLCDDDPKTRIYLSKFWRELEYLKNIGKEKKFRPNELEFCVLLTLLGSKHATTHYRSKDFWRRKKFNLRDNYEHPGRWA